MPTSQFFIEDNNYNHWDLPPLSGFIYTDVLKTQHLKQLKNEIKNIIDSPVKSTFLTNTTIIHDGEKEIKLGVNYFNDRYQNVIFDYTYHPEYWYQTHSSIYDWIFTNIYNSCSPNFVNYLQTILTLSPFDERKYIPYRLHLNYLPYNYGLSMHIDSNFLIFTDEVDKARHYSLTFYLDNHKENVGGELYTINGFVYKPKENTAIAMNGHQTPHGVTHNMSADPRLAFTIRWAHIDDLFLPGHPDKHLYKMDHL